ncbi:MAG: hypothetical protein AUI14_12120 [Actinobacteria bacterium 13_2_20CM_2_71_6]|nr:MAG: hypothetical protein AUI14_12120 [Actinobacteria bacterium 13_2_20CM_2_71_6]
MQMTAGSPSGAHASTPFVLAGMITVTLRLWQLVPGPVFVSLDAASETGAFCDGLLFDLSDARVAGRVMGDLVRLAEREAAP